MADASNFVTQLLDQISKGEPLSVHSLLTYATYAMQLIETGTKGLKGDEKFSILNLVVSKLIASAPLSDDEKAELQTMADMLLHTFADILCRASKGLIGLNKLTSCC